MCYCCNWLPNGCCKKKKIKTILNFVLLIWIYNPKDQKKRNKKKLFSHRHHLQTIIVICNNSEKDKKIYKFNFQWFLNWQSMYLLLYGCIHPTNNRFSSNEASDVGDIIVIIIKFINKHIFYNDIYTFVKCKFKYFFSFIFSMPFHCKNKKWFSTIEKYLWYDGIFFISLLYIYTCRYTNSQHIQCI